MSGPPRRRPFPYDLVIGSTGLMLGQKDPSTPQLVGTKVQPFISAAPDDYTYDTMPPLYERVQPYNDLTLGFGLRKQGSYQDKKYRYAQGVDCSIAGLLIKGPNVVTFPPVTTDATKDGAGNFFEIGGILFCAMGRYILKRVSDSSWTVAKDWNAVVAGAYNLNVSVFASSGTGTVLAWASLSGTTAYWSTDGTTWVAADGSAAKPNHTNLCTLQAGNDFWRASDINQLSKCDTDADPTLAANWTNANSFRVGDKTSPIVNLALSAVGSLLIFKTDGLYTLDDNGDQHKLFASVAAGVASDTENGRYVGGFGNDTHFTYGHNHLRAVPTVSFGTPRLDLEEIGPEKFTENDSPVRGRITAFVGNGAMGAYAALYNDDSTTSWLLKFSSWLTPVMSQGQLEEAKRIDAWHGAIDALQANGTATFANKKITQMWRTPIGSAGGATHYRMYGACSDGTLFWFELPCVPNPLGCTSYLYTTLDAYLYLPYTHFTFEADAKSLRSVSVLSTLLSATNSLRFDYKIDPTQANYASIGTTFTTAVRQRENFPNSTSVYLADFRATFISSNSGSTPQVTAITVHHAVRPALVLIYDMRVLAADGLVRRNGTPYKTIGAVQIRTIVKAAAAATGSVAMILPDQSSQELSVVDYKESLAWDVRLHRWTGALDVTAVQYIVNTVYGTWGREDAYRWGDLLSYTWTQAQGL